MIWVLLLLLISIGLGLLRLRFDAEVLNLLPADAVSVQGLKLFQQHFANARELVITVRGPGSEQTENAARTIAERLRQETNLIAGVVWQPPWLEHPGQAAELIAYLWLNQPPADFAQLADRLTPTNLPTLLAAAREQLATSMSPADIAQLSYDPFGLSRLPETVQAAAPGFGKDQNIFASADGTFRILFVQATRELISYRDCARWLSKVQQVADAAIPPAERKATGISVRYTGRPAFVNEIASGMERDITGSVGGTALIIAILFWLAHRRWKPMLWLLVLLAVILFGTLALGGLIFGTINIISMGFAAILLGLAVDYAVVHYQEALAYPHLSIPEVRRAIAPSIFWAALTTIAAFLVLNFSGLPGLAQLGSLVGLGVTLAALVMIFAYLPPLFPHRMTRQPLGPQPEPTVEEPPDRARTRWVYILTIGLLAGQGIILATGLPAMDSTADSLRPRNSSAYTALEEIKVELGQKQEPLWLIVGGKDATEVAQRLDTLEPILAQATENKIIRGATAPTALWPRRERQQANRPTAQALVTRRAQMRAAAKESGFADSALSFTDSILDTWQAAGTTAKTFWPSNEMSSWIMDKLTARSPAGLFALVLIYPAETSAATGAANLSALSAQLTGDDIWLSGWPLLGPAILQVVRAKFWKVLLPMAALILATLWFAFRRPTEVLLSLSILLLSGLGLLSVMRLAGWSWNLMNLMALPLILGTGVDYSIFMQLALRRHHGQLRAVHRSVGRALLLCGGTAFAGFGSLAFSSNGGMASLGQVCAVGIAFNVLISVLLLPTWWRLAVRKRAAL